MASVTKPLKRPDAHFWLVLAVIAVGIGLRLHYLTRSMRFDEALTFLAFASRDIPSIMADYSQPNNHIFHTLLMHLAYALFGSHPMILRLPVFVSGALTLPLVYQFARRTFSRHIGLLACGLAAVSPPLIDFSVNGRGYGVQTLLVVLLFLMVWRLRRYNRPKEWLALSVVSALGFLTLPTMLYPMGALAIWLLLVLLWQTRAIVRRRLLTNYVVAMVLGAGLTFVLYLPVILFSGLSRLVANDAVLRLASDDPMTRFVESWRNLAAYLGWGVPLPLALLIGVGAVVGIIVHRRLSKTPVSPLIVALGWLALALFVVRVAPYPRTMTPLLPIYFTAAAAGLYFLWAVVLKQRRTFGTFAVALVAVGAAFAVQSNVLFTSSDTGWAEDAETAALYFAQHTGASDIVFYSWPTNYPVLYYERLHGLDPAARPPSDTPRQYIYYHSAEERQRVIDALISDVHPNYANATFRIAHTFDHSTLEEVMLP